MKKLEEAIKKGKRILGEAGAEADSEGRPLRKRNVQIVDIGHDPKGWGIHSKGDIISEPRKNKEGEYTAKARWKNKQGSFTGTVHWAEGWVF